MLAPPNCIAGQMLRQRHPTLPGPVFFRCVEEAVGIIEEAAPQALSQVDIGVEEVPEVGALWSSHMPLAASVDPTGGQLAQIVLYRRPIELRSADREQLSQLVFVALLEQVSSVTGLSMSTLDPSNRRGD
jgi:predicted Zn-dependent protease with MMP-like domain